MVWSNWQGAIWRGAMLVVFVWSGLAWAQAPATRPVGATPERIMVVHENGKSTRCRVMESWQLPDGRIAHLLQAVETGEMVTIVDEAAPGANAGTKNARAMPKRIFSWGLGRRMPPEGSPIPPQLRHDSGIVLTNEGNPPVGAVPATGPEIVNRVLDEKALGGSTLVECPLPVVNSASRPAMPTPTKTVATQVIEFPHTASGQANMNPPPTIIINEAPEGTASNPTPMGEPKSSTIMDRPPLFPRVNAILTRPGVEARPAPGVIVQTAPEPTMKPPVVMPLTPLPPIGISNAPAIVEQPRPFAGVDTKPAIEASAPKVALAPLRPLPIEPSVEPVKPATSKPMESAVKKSWRPGDMLFGWMHKQTTPSQAKSEPKKTEEPKKEAKSGSLLTPDNKLGEKRLADRVANMPKVPFSTAMSQTLLPSAPARPDEAKPAVAPLSIPSPLGKKDEKPSVVSAPKGDAKPIAVGPVVEKRTMWGLGASDKSILPPGKSLVDPAAVKADLVKLPAAPVARKDDPLTTPERFIPSGDKLKPKAAMLAPITPGYAGTTKMLPPPQETAQPNGWPVGSQSVLAARNGLQGPVTYVPVPIVTQPQPNQPPSPPAPNMPEAPQLNAYVNAFSSPPAPRPAGHPDQSSVPNWMQPNANAMMPQQATQQQAMQQYAMQQQAMQQYAMQQQAMQQYAMQQQMVQQQAMMAQGYRPNPAQGYSPYAAMPPQAYGTPYGANPTLAAGHGPAGYPSAMQPASYQQMPTQQAVVTQQVEQLIKVMRESPYPAQREWAAQSLTSFEWRSTPQIVPALLQTARQDPAASVRAGCVLCLGRMGAAVEPVFGTLHSMRNDIDPRVRQEVEQALVRLGQTPMAPH